MSDMKRSCPACDSWTSSIGEAVAMGQPCPYCGLPADVFNLIDKAAKKNVDAKVLDRLAQAERRAVDAEREAARLRDVLATVRRSLERADKRE